MYEFLTGVATGTVGSYCVYKFWDHLIQIPAVSDCLYNGIYYYSKMECVIEQCRAARKTDHLDKEKDK